MQHIEEHILELYVLNSDKVSSHRAEIEAHLRVCHGCRDLVEQMKESYRSVEQRFNRLGTDSAMSSRTLVRSRTGLETSSKRDAPQIVSYRPVRRVQQLTYFIRRHPVAVGSSSFMTLAGLALLGNLLFKTPAITDKNPAHVHYNPGSNQVEVLNKVNQSLWQMPSRDLQAMEKGEMEARTTRTTVADINGDGANEVLTTLWTFADSVSGPSALKVYDTNGDLQFLFQFKG